MTPRDSQQWDPPYYGKLDPYYSHIFRDSYGSGMGIVRWVRGPIIGVPENPTDYLPTFG